MYGCKFQFPNGDGPKKLVQAVLHAPYSQHLQIEGTSIQTSIVKLRSPPDDMASLPSTPITSVESAEEHRQLCQKLVALLQNQPQHFVRLATLDTVRTLNVAMPEV